MYKLYTKIYGKISKFRFFEKLSTVKTISPYLSEQGLWQFIKYFTVGVATALFELFLVWLFSKILLSVSSWRESAENVLIVVGNTLGTTVAFVANFLLNRSVSFKSDGKFSVQFIKYILLFLFNLIVSDIIIYVFSSIGVYYLIVKLFTMAMIVLWNFFMYKKFIFK
ncbi:MAG: GtrA family protein [Ruminococcaceae bacterium]|nr:GtrA family protein [Oscillospiraceae bacterium]